MICSSVNLFFTSNLPSSGLDSRVRRYSNTGRRREGANTGGLRKPPIAALGPHPAPVKIQAALTRGDDFLRRIILWHLVWMFSFQIKVCAVMKKWIVMAVLAACTGAVYADDVNGLLEKGKNGSVIYDVSPESGDVMAYYFSQKPKWVPKLKPRALMACTAMLRA